MLRAVGALHLLYVASQLDNASDGDQRRVVLRSMNEYLTQVTEALIYVMSEEGLRRKIVNGLHESLMS
jgi:hypothetical protein